MADIGELVDNKLISLALQGYNPFHPDVGIFCGGYQGIMYPNPTTLSYPGFDPYQHTEPIPTTYLPTDDYGGLGKGNPGIDYKNPGHILGLLDTFGRMSYGIGVLQAIHAGQDGSDVQPILDINMPLFLNDGTNSPIGLSDIYPAYTEIPSDWINGFSIDSSGNVDPDLRPLVILPVLSGYKPTTSIIDKEAFISLFGNKILSSYVGLPEYFRNIIESLATSSLNLNNLSSMNFTINDDEIFNTYLNRVFFNNPNAFALSGLTRESEGIVYAENKTNTPIEALRILTGSENYHDGVSGINDFRSLTELNSVINIIPLQMVGSTYWVEFVDKPTAGDPPNSFGRHDRGRTIFPAAYMLIDFIINVSDVPLDIDSPVPGTISITGQATVRNLITDPTEYWITETNPIAGYTSRIEGTNEKIIKRVNILISSTNEFTWDKAWLNVPAISDSAIFSDEISLQTSEFPVPATTLDQTPLIVPFSKTFTLGAGCTSIRLRAFLDSSHFGSQRSMLIPEDWGGDTIATGATFNAYVNNPENIKNDLASPSLELSFTVTGTNMNPQTYSVQI